MMNKEYLYYSQTPLEYPLSENVEVTTQINSDEFIVSNVPTSKAQIHAPEIDFYIKNTQDDISHKIVNVERLNSSFQLSENSIEKVVQKLHKYKNSISS